MGFFEKFLHREGHTESVVLIDIGASFVTGAYVRYQEGEQPVLLYTRRLPIEIRKEEAHERAMLRALAILGEDLIREGAPALARETGSGRVDMILVSVDEPWQETTVRTELFEQEEPFVFTKNMIMKRLEETNVVPSEKMLADESIISTALNGYETNSPYGKSARRASVIVLTSLIERKVASSILETLEGLYHTRSILPIAGNSLRYQAMRALFPHELDAIILDATGKSFISIELIRKGILVSIAQVPSSSDEKGWVSVVTKELEEIAKNYPLPRTIFLLAREPEITSLRQALDTARLGALWFSDNPPKIVPVLKSHITGSVRQTATESSDIVVLFMVLYYQYRHRVPDEIS